MYTEKRTYTEEEYRLGLLEQCNVGILETLTRIDKRLNSIENKMDAKFTALENKIDTKFDIIDIKLDDIRKEAKSDFRWLLGIMGALSATLGGIVAHGFHWF